MLNIGVNNIFVNTQNNFNLIVIYLFGLQLTFSHTILNKVVYVSGWCDLMYNFEIWGQNWHMRRQLVTWRGGGGTDVDDAYAPA